jgi:hypothetical protein
MKKLILIITLLCFTSVAFSQQIANAGKSQYLLIVRFKTDFKPTSDEAVKNNIKKWQEYMGGLAKSGSLVSGYRPATEGLTISGTNKSIKSTAYISDDEQISSIIIVSAENMDAAKAIADKCPVFEFGGSVEVRPVMNMAGQ